MSTDYSEILCTAIDEIITTRLQGLSYDITKLCTIIDDTYSYQGKYKVSDGTAKYDAFTTDNNLKKGNSVLVTIPNGDYSLQKTIKGRISSTDTTPFKYTSPLDTMVFLETDKLDLDSKEYGLVANGQKTLIGPIYSIDNGIGIQGFTRLGVQADFKSLLTNFNVEQGTYGIKLLIESESLDSPGSSKSVFYDLDFNSTDLIGNPYQFEDYFSQEKVFDISYVKNIKNIKIYFYQNNDFIDGNKEKISSTIKGGEEIGLEEIETLNNLYVNNIKLFLGYDASSFKGEDLFLYTNDSQSYHYSQKTSKKIELRWIHAEDDGKSFRILNKSSINDQYNIKWFRYAPGAEEVDKYAGKDWENIKLAEDSFEYNFDPDYTKQTEQIKVIGIIKSFNNDSQEQLLETAYFSNILTFENEEKVPDSTTINATTALTIYCEDGSEGNYFIYNQNGKINNQGIGQGYQRTLKALYKGAEITSDIGKLDWIRWYIPYNSESSVNNSMIIAKGYFTEKEVFEKDYTFPGRDTSYWIIERKPNDIPDGDGKIKFISDEQSYSIANQWSAKKANNTIICRVSINGIEYEAIEEMRFGKTGTNGTNTTFLLEFEDNKNALEAEEGATISVSAWLYNEEGAKNGFTNATAKDIVWSWKQTSLIDEADANYISLPDGEIVNGWQITLTSNINEVPKDNYYILQAKYNELEAYLPIPLKAKNVGYIEGAREIIYDHQGIPSYYNDIYNLYSYEDAKYLKQKNVQWDLIYADNTINKSYLPSFKNNAGEVVESPTIQEVSLCAAPFFTTGYNEKICITASKNGQVLWAQPLLIMQSRYDFAMLNNWDGSLTLDEDNATILSTMLGAGRKNANNTFSGVLIGDIKKGTELEDANTLTGVYGFQEGKISYAFTEDGKATLGASGNGQIIIDGIESVIKTKGYDTIGSPGMKIDLNEGLLDIQNNSHESLIHLSAGLNKENNNDPYFLVKTTEGKDLIRVDDNNYYLQSNNYSTTSGSRYDLMSGDFSVAGPGGSFKVSPQNNSSLLEIQYYETLDNGLVQNRADLLKVGGDDYFLQSKDFNYSELIDVYNDEGVKIGQLYNISIKVKDNYQDDTGDEISQITIVQESLDDGSIGNIIYTVIEQEGKYYQGSKINFNPVYQSITTSEGTVSKQVLTADQNREKYAATAQPVYKDNTFTGKGFKLDLNNNLIEGYNLRITGTKSSDTDKQIIIDSDAPEYPLRIGKNFKVDWNGKVYCTNPTLNGSGGSINLGSFYFNSSGAGGGTWSGNSLGVNGFSGMKLSSLETVVLAK